MCLLILKKKDNNEVNGSPSTMKHRRLKRNKEAIVTETDGDTLPMDICDAVTETAAPVTEPNKDSDISEINTPIQENKKKKKSKKVDSTKSTETTDTTSPTSTSKKKKQLEKVEQKEIKETPLKKAKKAKDSTKLSDQTIDAETIHAPKPKKHSSTDNTEAKPLKKQKSTADDTSQIKDKAESPKVVKKSKNKEKENVVVNTEETHEIKKQDITQTEVKKASVNAFAMMMQTKGVIAKTASPSPNGKKRKRDNQ